MSEPLRILILGGYGVFGRLLARELLNSMDVQVVVAGRDINQAVKVCRVLGAGKKAEPLALDLNDLKAVSRAAAGCFAVVCTAGPFQNLPKSLPVVVAKAGSHWLDISDFSGWVLSLLSNKSLHEIAADAKTVVMPGMSTVPAVSGAMLRWGCKRVPGASRAQVTLFISNRNSKGSGTILSALESGFHNPVPVNLPMGRRVAYRFQSPDEALLREDLGVEGEYRVAFEWPMIYWIIRVGQKVVPMLGNSWRVWLGHWLSLLATPFNWLGSDLSCLKAEVFSESGRRATCIVKSRGQRLAVLPCLLAVEALQNGELRHRGCLSPTSWLSPEQWVERLCAYGIQFEGEAS